MLCDFAPAERVLATHIGALWTAFGNDPAFGAAWPGYANSTELVRAHRRHPSGAQCVKPIMRASACHARTVHIRIRGQVLDMPATSAGPFRTETSPRVAACALWHELWADSESET